ncbi:MAG: DUF4230 domain-containing protein [Verrucomicrobia bacterium]|jgi:hypothetical protein|nr:MAG: DUF4230 domain-containing protein [Verrucomicrobiota bacterium]
MLKLRLFIGAFVLVIILALGVWLGFVIRSVTSNSGANAYNTAVVLRQVQTLSQLVTVKYVMEKVLVYEDVKWFPGGDNRVLMIAHGVVKAGVDLDRLKPEDIQVHEKKVKIKLPAAQIMDCYLDDKQTQVVERTTGLLRTFDKDLEQTARKIAVDDVRRGARAAGILKDADERALAQVEKLFQQMGLEVEFIRR